MKREVDVERARIAWNFLQLPYVKRATLLQEFALPGAEPHEEILSEVLDRLTSEGRLEEFGERVTAKMEMVQLTVVLVRQDCATETKEGRYVTFREGAGNGDAET